MSENSKIEWTDHTFNPWWGCTRVSAGCANCYAETFAARWRVGWGDKSPRRPASEKVWAEPYRWNAAAKRLGVRHRVFCSSMADVFEDRPELVPLRARLWELIKATPNLDWLLLTKRPENLLDMLPLAHGSGWPWPHVWLGASVEDQPNLDRRVRALLRVPAAVRFVSYEPALGPIDFRGLLGCKLCEGVGSVPALGGGKPCPACFDWAQGSPHKSLRLGRLDWVIVGGESGPKARPFDVCWAEDVVRQCREAGIACFVKQLGAVPFDSREGHPQTLPHPLGPAHDPDCRLRLHDPKGGDPEEWPEALRVREFPGPRP